MASNNGFSVLMAVYWRDDAELFARSLSSIYSNTEQPTKVVLVADGPLNHHLERVIANFSVEPTLLVVRLPQNMGLARALNHGLTYVETEFVVRADADDFNLPNRFEVLLSNLRRDIDLVGSAILEVDRDQRPIAIRRLPLAHSDIVRFARRRNPFNHMSVAFRRQLVCGCGGYPDIHLKEDYALWARMLSDGARTMNVSEVLVHATAGKDMYRRRGGFKYAAAEFGLQMHLVDLKLKSPIAALLDGSLRALIFLAPAPLRALIYLALLRQGIRAH